tara:strand:+ start:370 stop:516 length:147 start_codon:yes stop_codon:yes gene_type:complete
MIKQILQLLGTDDWYGQSKNIDIAKGKYKAVANWSEMMERTKREYYGK